MAYENLLRSVEESAQERERDLREKARNAIQAISEETRNQVSAIQQSFLEESKKTAAIEKNKFIYVTKGENKEKLITTKEKIFSTAFAQGSGSNRNGSSLFGGAYRQYTGRINKNLEYH